MTSTSAQPAEPAEDERPRRTAGRWAVFAATVVLQLAVVYAPSAGPGGGVPYLDKLVHAVIFGAVAWAGLRLRLPAAALLGVLALHAVGSEILQSTLLPRRSGDALDAVADIVGIAIGVLIAGHSFERSERASRRRQGSSLAARKAGEQDGGTGGP